MDMYLLKFSACLFVFWLIYIFLLEQQIMHRFKRFYLLGTIAIALTIPLLTITYYVEPIATYSNANTVLIESDTIEETSSFQYQKVLWLVYTVGTLLFFVRFCINLIRLNKKISKNEKIYERSFIYILLQEDRVPHSFFKYIFLNKINFENGTIPKEVLLHEETHAKQWHSLDIVILELLQIAFWFHPLIYILKHHAKLNHEFLADESVLEEGVNTKTYQNILLQFSSPDGYRDHQNCQLSSAINYSSFKKRFTVMKTQTSKTKMWWSISLLLPVIAILFLSFADYNKVIKNTVKKPTTENRTEHFTQSQNKTYNPSFLEYIIEMEKLGASFYLDGKKISSEKAKFIAQNNKGKRTDMLTQKDENGLYLVKLSSPVKIQQQKEATKKQVAEYNKLAKYYNTVLKEKQTKILLKDVEKLKYLYSIMSVEQRKSAEPFPDFPEPPQPPPAPEKANLSVKKLNEVEPPAPPKSLKARKIREPEAPVKALTVEEKENMRKQIKAYKEKHPKKMVEVEAIEAPTKELKEITPPPPPPPPSPLDFVIKMAKRDAIFYYESKQISSDKAIELLKKNSELNVRSKKTDTKPLIYISKEPMVIDVRKKTPKGSKGEPNPRY